LRTKASRTRSRSTRPVDYVAVAIAYAEDAVQDRRKYGRWVRLAAKRFLADLKHAQTKRPRFLWSPGQANRACEFIELLPHVEGSWDSLTIRLEPAQVFFLCALFGFRNADGSRRFTTALFAVGRKNGKALALDTPIPTPSGWTTMRAISPGDRVIGADGRPCNVVSCSPVFADHECYRLTFSNDEVVIADAGHRWITTARVDQPNGNRVGNRQTRKRVRTTEEIARTLRYGARGDFNHSLQMPAFMDLPEADLPFPPYTLGAWLGDGTSASGRITFMPSDREIRDGIEADGLPIKEQYSNGSRALTYALTNGDRSQAARNNCVAARLRALGVLNAKHVPAAYLRASRQQRLALLQGLMDTDGTVSKSGRVLAFTSTNHRLAVGVAELLATFGIKHSIKPKVMRCNGRPVVGLSWSIQFMAFRDELPVFRLRRKLDRMRCRASCDISPRSKTVQIVSAEKVESVPVRCISVDSPDRQFLFGRTMLPTHNSALAAAILLYVFCTEPELGPQVLSAATTGSQARIVWGVAKRMVEKTPALREAFSLEPFANAIARYEVGGTFRPINAKASSQDGLNPSALCFDELHAHKTRDLFDVLRSAAGARKSPLFLYTTTEGYENPGPWAEVRTFMRQVLEGVVDADHFLAVYYALDEDDDDFDESKWIKANPLLGISVSLSELRKHAIEAKQQPGSLAEFQIKRLNRQAAAAEGFIDLRRWRRCSGELPVEKLRGAPCWAAIDLAATTDMNAWAMLWKIGAIYYARVRYWVPESAVKSRTERRTASYAGWVEAGHIQMTEGDVVDYSAIEADVLADCELYGPKLIAYDPWNATQFAQRLTDAGLELRQFIQGLKSYTPAMKELERAYTSGALRHGGNPVLTWNAANLVARRDGNLNMAPDKKRSADKIDGIVALIMAFGLAVDVDDAGDPDGFFKKPVRG
jgi:phage terminase large subunit-like protein